MANSDLIAKMQSVVDDYEVGRILPEQVEQALEFHMQALEGVDLPAIHKVRSFSYRLVAAHLADGEQEFRGDERVSTVLAELRCFLHSLPAASSA